MYCSFYFLFLVGISPFVLRNPVVTGAPTIAEPLSSKPDISIDALTFLSGALQSLSSIEGAPEFLNNIGFVTAVNKCVDTKVLASIVASMTDAFQNEERVNQQHVVLLTSKSIIKLHKMLMCVLIKMYKDGSLDNFVSPLKSGLGVLSQSFNLASFVNSFDVNGFKNNVDVKALTNGNVIDALNNGAVDLNGLTKDINLETVAKGLQVFF
ncbi:uncharacterized protein [Diabrotica undecimpunctata]|uniref:uncharacterized protein n=1 Tax=Diabrotica undecimpunctata TaxID=50387 RepID=UPI003B639F01